MDVERQAYGALGLRIQPLGPEAAETTALGGEVKASPVRRPAGLVVEASAIRERDLFLLARNVPRPERDDEDLTVTRCVDDCIDDDPAIVR